MAEGLRIRENPALAPIYCNHLINVQWDGSGVLITLGYESARPERTGEKTSGEITVLPVSADALPYKVAIELHEKLGQLLQAIQNTQKAQLPS
jgi:hypothetical protein